MKYRVFDINWDTSGDDVSPREERKLKRSLPTEVEIELDEEPDVLDDAIGDKLGNRYGFCVFGFDYEEVA